MTEERQSAGRWNEAELRRSPAPRIPRIPEPASTRQTIYTLMAVIAIFLAVAAWMILR